MAQTPSLTKYWDEKRGRMALLLKNGERPLRDITVEDKYPASIAGILCFAKAGGIAPMASASDGKITWKVANMGPGEVKELIYTSLTRDALEGSGSKKPTAADAALLSSMSSCTADIIHGRKRPGTGRTTAASRTYYRAGRDRRR